MRYFLFFCRLLVGSLFIVSGLIKANDPLGFSFKLEEYFAEDALNMTFWAPYSLWLGILACTAEIVLGFAVLFGGRMKLATASLVALTLFFGWLTAFTGHCNDMHDKGTPLMFAKLVEAEQGDSIARVAIERIRVTSFEGDTMVVIGEDTVNVQKEGDHAMLRLVQEKHCVTDCGCFGDAMKGSLGRSLTPWESFTKDLVLFLFILPITIVAWRKPGITWNTEADDRVLLTGGLVFVGFFSWVFTWWGPLWFTGIGFALYLLIKRRISGAKAEWITSIMAAVLSLAFIYWCIEHLPVRDYRPYAVGKNLLEQKSMGRAPTNDIFLVYKNKITGEEKEFTDKNHPWQDTVNWAYMDRRLVETDPGVPSLIQDFMLTDQDGQDVTQGILEEPGPVLLFVSRNVKEAQTSCIASINALADSSSKAGWYFYGVTSNGYPEVQEFKHGHQTPFDYLTCDEITLKTVNRSNPGLMLLKHGVVLGQWHCNDVPSFAEVKELVK